MQTFVFDSHEVFRIRRIAKLEQAVKDVLFNAKVAWRGATLSELCDMLLKGPKEVRKCLIDGEFVHCPVCDYWFGSRGIDPVIPKGTRHQLYHCPLAIPDESLEGQLARRRNGNYFSSRQRAKALPMRRVPLCASRQNVLLVRQSWPSHEARIPPNGIRLFDPSFITDPSPST